MALATVTSNSFGLRATGGTDATTITTFRTRTCAFIFIAGAAADTCAITDARGNAIMTLTSPGAAGDILEVDLHGVPIEGIGITLSNAAGVLIVLVD